MSDKPQGWHHQLVQVTKTIPANHGGREVPVGTIMVVCSGPEDDDNSAAWLCTPDQMAVSQTKRQMSWVRYIADHVQRLGVKCVPSGMPTTPMGYLKVLTGIVAGNRESAAQNIVANKHLTGIDKELPQAEIDGILVWFLNTVGMHGGIDYAIAVRDLPGETEKVKAARRTAKTNG